MPPGLQGWPLYWLMMLKRQHVDPSGAGQNHLTRQLLPTEIPGGDKKHTRKDLLVEKFLLSGQFFCLGDIDSK